jgi:hypothetical protein
MRFSPNEPFLRLYQVLAFGVCPADRVFAIPGQLEVDEDFAITAGRPEPAVYQTPLLHIAQFGPDTRNHRLAGPALDHISDGIQVGPGAERRSCAQNLELQLVCRRSAPAIAFQRPKRGIPFVEFLLEPLPDAVTRLFNFMLWRGSPYPV